jgi:hypothetical protein
MKTINQCESFELVVDGGTFEVASSIAQWLSMVQ